MSEGMEVMERARLYVSKMPLAIEGSGGSVACLNVARALRHGFGLTLVQAWPVMVEYSERCSPPWTIRELQHKLESVEKMAFKTPRGHLLGRLMLRDGRVWNGQGGGKAPSSKHQAPENDEAPGSNGDHRNWREYDAGALEGEQRGDIEVDAEWLWKRSPVDCRSMAAGRFLEAVSLTGDRVLVLSNERSQGQYIFWKHMDEGRRGWYRLGERRGEPARFVSGPGVTPGDLLSARCGVWWLCQPVTGEWRSNGEKWSRRSEGNVADWRTMVIESDEEGIEQEWLNLLVQLPLRIAALYTSGGRSVHALVRVDLPSKQAWDQLRDFLKPVLTRLGADKGVFSAVRLTRLPGCKREGKNGKDGKYVRFAEPRLQRLLYLNPMAEIRPVIELPVLRAGAMEEEEGM